MIVDQLAQSLESLERQLALYEPGLLAAQSYARSLMKSVPTTGKPLNVEDAKSVEVGKVYGVEVATTKNNQWLNMTFPLLGPLHQDCEITEMDAAYDHWHVDWRFFPDALYQTVIGAWRQASGGSMQDLTGFLMHMLISEESIDGPPERRALRCVRPHGRFRPTAQAPWLADLEKLNEGKRVECGRCPHRGFSLAGAVEDSNGVRLCPGHGLAWDRKGELVRQTTW